MKEKKLGISLKYKLLLLLTTIPVVSLTIYILLATQLFENDKIAYVKDSSVSVAKALSVQFRTELNGFLEKLEPIVESYDYNEQKFSENSNSLFNKFERIDGLILMQRSSGGSYVRLGALKKSNQFGEAFLTDEVLINKTREETMSTKLFITNVKFSEMHLLISTSIGEVNSVNNLIVIALYRANDLFTAFTKANIYEHFLLDKTGKVRLGPPNATLADRAAQEILKSTLPEGALDVVDQKAQIVSYADTGVSGMKVTAIVDRNTALAAVNALLIKSLMFFIALISTTVIISVIASVKLTSTLRELYEATKLIAKGQFDVRVKSTSNDEIGGLADGFNFMAGEVSRLMLEASEGARMAGELETVKLVQDTLFPNEKLDIGNYHVVGHFEPASECGGDWWNYSQIGDKLYLWIGDATGHGAPAAMVTSAAKSAVTIIEDLPHITPGKALEIMNKAIHETSKGRILMTFFIAAIDMKTGELTYANASHEPPYLIHARKDGAKTTKKDLFPLIEARGPRLGDSRLAQYNEVKIQLNVGDIILLYTDGIVDLVNSAGKSWGERGLIKSICESTGAGATAESKMLKMKTNIASYRETTALVDDITLLVCQYDGAA